MCALPCIRSAVIFNAPYLVGDGVQRGTVGMAPPSFTNDYSSSVAQRKKKKKSSGHLGSTDPVPKTDRFASG